MQSSDNSSSDSALPFEEALPKLIKSVMSAQRILAQHIKANNTIRDGLLKATHGEINEPFRWLIDTEKNYGLSGSDGRNRHLFEDPHPDWDGIVGLRETFGTKQQGKPTRISRLVFQSFWNYEADFTADKKIKLQSPLSICMEILSDPNTPGISAYSLATIRNFIFNDVGGFPKLVNAEDTDVKKSSTKAASRTTFDVTDATEAIDRVWTSFRPRGQSQGKDTISAYGKQKVDTVIRAWLATKGIALLFFANIDSCISYLENQEWLSTNTPYTLQKSPKYNYLPNSSRIVNELWGLPLPIRGADLLFQGGLKFPESGGLVMAIHGDPGAGKTSLALSIAALLTPLNIKTLFITADGKEQDLKAKISQIIPDTIKRLSFFSNKTNLTKHIKFEEIDTETLGDKDIVTDLIKDLEEIANYKSEHSTQDKQPSLPCSSIVVLDGLHDIFNHDHSDSLNRLYKFIAACRSLKMLVLLTSGTEWEKNTRLDYLVDVSCRLDQELLNEYGTKPDRRLTLTKTRHQLSALGKHGFRLNGHKGVRFSPQINYSLDVRSIMSPKLPNNRWHSNALQMSLDLNNRDTVARLNDPLGSQIKTATFRENQGFVKLYYGSHIFINGRGSSGKAGLALKIALSPYLDSKSNSFVKNQYSNLLVVSFLYPDEYYRSLFKRILELQPYEFKQASGSQNNPKHDVKSRLNVIDLYPGHLRPDDLFNRVEKEIDLAELNGTPYTSVIVDGLHNVPIQFPELEKNGLFWPQLFKSLRTRDLTVIATHTTLVLPDAEDTLELIGFDDSRSDPLRHAMVQKTDFQFQIDPIDLSETKEQLNEQYGIEDLGDLFSVRCLSAIGQPVPNQNIFWSRSQLVAFEDPRESSNSQLEFPLPSPN